jgi:hypothetical protein
MMGYDGVWVRSLFFGGDESECIRILTQYITYHVASQHHVHCIALRDKMRSEL